MALIYVIAGVVGLVILGYVIYFILLVAGVISMVIHGNEHTREIDRIIKEQQEWKKNHPDSF